MLRPELIVLAGSTFVSEDLTCIAAGALVAQAALTPVEAVAACSAGIFLGDLALYLCGRMLGGRFVREEKYARAGQWLRRRGPIVVLLSRFTPGTRLPVYVASGLARVPVGRFSVLLLFSCLLWTPLLVLISARLGEGILASALASYAQGVSRVALAAGAVGAGWMVIRRAGRISASLRMWGRWEFWPAWAAYLPLVPYLVWLALRHRSATLFTVANPGMEFSGFAGESKSEILKWLPGAAPFRLISSIWTAGTRLSESLKFVAGQGGGFPVVTKPDVGERGRGVAVARSAAELERCLRETPGDVIIQRYAEGIEFGVYYCRLPGEAMGRVSSIVEKRFPVLVGDGRSPVLELLLRDARASRIAATYRRLSKYPMDYVAAAGERMQLVEIGAHCRGAVFLDARRHITPALSEAIDRIAKHHPGFHLGRFDLKVPSAESLRAGRDLTVIELNGVTAEPAHIYDPAVSVTDAYRALMRHWRLAFEAGARNRALGHRPVTLAAFARLLWALRRRSGA